MWAVRLSREAVRWMLWAVAIAGLAAAARFAVAPPQPAPVPGAGRARPQADRAAEGFAVLFARRYLTWSSAEAAGQTLAAYAGAGVEPGFGFVAPSSGEQRVAWAEVVQAREPAPGEHVYTVAAQTDVEGLLYLSVEVLRTGGGDLAIAGYPAFVGPPASGPASVAASLPEVADGSLSTMVQRALRNYLAGSTGELAADLSADARVSLPAIALTLESLRHLEWTPGGRSVLALVQAADARGAQYTLGYELDVERAQGRWEVSAIQMDPDS